MLLASRLQFFMFVLTVSFLGNSSSWLHAQESVQSDRRLPPGVLLYASTPDIPASYEAFRNTSYGQLINGPEMEAFRVQLMEKFEEEAAEGFSDIEDQLGMPLSDLAALAAGDATFAILRPIGQPLGAVMFLEYGDHHDIMQHLMSKAEQQIEANSGRTKQTEEVAGTEISFYSIETEHPDYPVIDISYFTKDGQFVIGSSRSILESILERWDGQHQATFAADEIYSVIVEKCATSDGNQPDTLWFMNPIGLTTGALELVPQAKPFVGLIPLYLPTLGLNRLKGTGSAMEIDTAEFNTVSRSLMYVQRPAAGILKVFELRPTLEGPATWVPATATQYAALDWNVSGAYTAVEAVWDGFLGPGAFDRQITDLTRQANQNNLHLKNDVIDVIAGKVEGYVTPSEENEGIPTFAAAISITDEEKAWAIVDAAMESASSVEEHDLRGTRVVTTITPDDQEIAISIQDNKIYLASSLDRLSEILAGEAGGPALGDSAKFKRAKAYLPEKVSMISYQSAADQLRGPYEKLRTGGFDEQVDNQFDFSVLPPFESIEKYFAPSIGYFVPDENGSFSVQMGLKPEK